jgi:sterol desaturase/sphingolipid hydroxylase (fatty acid hydroxylase superfamily)
MIDLANLQIIVAGIILAILWTLEAVIPFLPNRRERVKHSARNITIGAFNAVILAVLYAPILFRLTAWTETNDFGLLRLFDLPLWASVISAVLLQDAWMYAWHRANHRFLFLWRFHKVHHSDPEMDASTAVRFHTGEILISAVLRLGIIAVLGLSLWQVLLYDLLIIPIILFHHSNVQFPEKLDKYYRALFASPAMHRIHHSPERIETDSNYSTVFSFWDRLARSFRLRKNAVELKYGLGEFTGTETERFSVLAMMPFQGPADSQKKESPQVKRNILTAS